MKAHASVKRNIKHRRKRSSSRSSSSRTYRKKHSHSKRNRKQRGGKTKEDAFRELKNLYYKCDLNSDAIKNAFEQLKFDVKDPPASCKKFRQLFRIRDENSNPDMILSKVVCYADIDKIDKIEETTMKHLMLKHDLYTPDSFTNWINFVKHMNRAVSEFASQDLPEPSRAQSQSSAAADELRPAPVVDSRPQLPAGWTRSGPDNAPIYFNSLNGHSQYEFPTMSAASAAVTPVTPVSAYDRLMALKDD